MWTIPTAALAALAALQWGMHEGGMPGFWLIGWWLGVLFGLLLLALLAVFLLAAVRFLRGQVPGRESAVEILKRRYARGELTREEYERMRRELE